MNIYEICIEINLPKEVLKIIEKYGCKENYNKYLVLLKNYNREIPSICKNVEEDSRQQGFDELYIVLEAAVYTYEVYQRMLIPTQVYWDTMKCFTRFVCEYKKCYGSYGFDRGYWVVRQLSLQLFRIGELEYEMEKKGKDRKIVVHVPSDSNMQIDNITNSLKAAKKFFRKYFPEYSEAEYMSGGWLLSPIVEKLVEKESNIYKYKQLYNIFELDMKDESYREWVFNNNQCKNENLQEDTSLQRKIKQKLLEGEQIGGAFGFIKKEVFQ